MEAKDTVMNLGEYNRFTKTWYEEQGKAELWLEADDLGAEYKATLEHQAEISFEARCDELTNKLALSRAEAEGYASQLLSVQQDCINAHKAGIKQVVEWLKDVDILQSNQYWQAKLKEWGVET